MKAVANYQSEVVNSFDKHWSDTYRKGDEHALENAGIFDHYGVIVQRLSQSFNREIDALDVGCGTGRYFHCLRNVRTLIGTDLSPHMLEHARNPIRSEQITIGNTILLCGDLPTLQLPDESFDFIYSVGVYGEYSPIDENLIRLFMRLLRPGGMFFVTAVDSTSRISIPEVEKPSFTRRVVRKLFPVLPAFVRIAINKSASPFYVTQTQVERAFSANGVICHEITSYVHTSGWEGTHLDCVGYNKTDSARPKMTD